MERRNDKKTVGSLIDSLRIKIIDVYIIKKFLGTFFFSQYLFLQ